MNTTLLMKWVDKIMGLRDGLDISILSKNYNSGLNWENRSALFRRASPYWQGLRQTFSPMCEFFITRLGDGLEFQLVGCLVAVRNFEGCIFALIRSYGTWKPIFDEAVSDQRLVELLCMQH